MYVVLQGKPYENVLMHLGGSVGEEEEEEVDVGEEVGDGGDGGDVGEEEVGDGEQQQLVVHKVILSLSYSRISSIQHIT